ncbi:hypothetical protein BC629DRAFT_577627 [Irpex lacteus]|nr:hypothetical protein BC629DRAFT_577627 [Irpex lacteus]
MARSRTPPSSLRRRTLSPEDMSYLSTGASVFNSTLPPQEVGIGEPGPSTRPGRMAGGLAAESMLSYEGARPTLSSMSQTHTRTPHALRDSSTPESHVQNAKRDLSKSVALSPPASTDGHLPNAQTRPQPQSQVTSTTTTPAHSLEPTKFIFGDPLTPAAFEARLKNSPRSEPTRNTQGSSSGTRRTEGATTSSSRSQTSRTSPQSTSTLSRPYPERSLSPEIPVYVPVPPSLPKRIHGRDEPTDEHGLLLVPGKTYFIGAPPSLPRPVTPQLDRSPISAYRSATSRGRGRGKGKRVSTGRPRGQPRKKPLEPLTTGLEPLSATTTVSRTGRPRGRPRKKPLELPTKGPDPLTSTTTVGVPVGYVPVYGLAFQGSVQPYYSSTLSHWPNANTNVISQSTAVKGKGKMPAHRAQDDVFGASASAPSTEPRELSSTNPVVSEMPDADMEWYLDMATVTWRKRPRQTPPAGVGPSSQAPAPERMTILPAPHSTSSLHSKARTPPRARPPSDPPSPEADAPSPTPSNLSLRSIPFVQVEPLKSRLRVRQGLQSHASIVSSEPSSSYRRSPSIVPDSEEEQEGESENQGSEGVEGVRAVEDSRLGSLTPSIPAHAHAAVDVTVPGLPKGVNSRGPGFDQAHEEDVTQRQITGIGAAAVGEEPNASSTLSMSPNSRTGMSYSLR